MIDLAPTFLDIAGLAEQAKQVITEAILNFHYIRGRFLYFIFPQHLSSTYLLTNCPPKVCFPAQLDGLSLLGRSGEERDFLVEYSGEGGEGVDRSAKNTVDLGGL